MNRARISNCRLRVRDERGRRPPFAGMRTDGLSFSLGKPDPSVFESYQLVEGVFFSQRRDTNGRSCAAVPMSNSRGAFPNSLRSSKKHAAVLALQQLLQLSFRARIWPARIESKDGEEIWGNMKGRQHYEDNMKGRQHYEDGKKPRRAIQSLKQPTRAIIWNRS
jgi:hypothetical protein